MLANIQNYDQRISAGKTVERKILDGLRQKGFNITDPTAEEDKIQKIDGWWIDKKGGKHPLQVKFRETGDDIIFELIKDIDKKIEGRDIKSQAEFYLVADRQGVTRLYQTNPIKKQARTLVNFFEREISADPFKTKWRGTGWELRLQIDRAGGQRKLVAYFDPRTFEALATWNLPIFENKK